MELHLNKKQNLDEESGKVVNIMISKFILKPTPPTTSEQEHSRSLHNKEKYVGFVF